MLSPQFCPHFGPLYGPTPKVGIRAVIGEPFDLPSRVLLASRNRALAPVLATLRAPCRAPPQKLQSERSSENHMVFRVGCSWPLGIVLSPQSWPHFGPLLGPTPNKSWNSSGRLSAMFCFSQGGLGLSESCSLSLSLSLSLFLAPVLAILLAPSFSGSCSRLGHGHTSGPWPSSSFIVLATLLARSFSGSCSRLGPGHTSGPWAVPARKKE